MQQRGFVPFIVSLCSPAKLGRPKVVGPVFPKTSRLLSRLYFNEISLQQQPSDNCPPRRSQDLMLLALQVQVSHKRCKSRRATRAFAQSFSLLETTLAIARCPRRGRSSDRWLRRAIARDMSIPATPKALLLPCALRRLMPYAVARITLTKKRRAFPRRACPAFVPLPVRPSLRCQLEPAWLRLRLSLWPRRRGGYCALYAAEFGLDCPCAGLAAPLPWVRQAGCCCCCCCGCAPLAAVATTAFTWSTNTWPLFPVGAAFSPAALLPPLPFPQRFVFLATVCHPPADSTVASLTESSSDACDMSEADATTSYPFSAALPTDDRGLSICLIESPNPRYLPSTLASFPQTPSYSSGADCDRPSWPFAHHPVGGTGPLHRIL